MIPETGNFALMLALCVALAQAILPIAGSFNGNQRWMALVYSPWASFSSVCSSL